MDGGDTWFDTSMDDRRVAPWLRTLLLPGLLFVVACAVIVALVLGGVIRGEKSYEPAAVSTTESTVLIRP